ncbi:sodium/bile acid cotransporter 7 [Leeuwenhoekiella aestuarii]|uniref:Sodium/bile acid cotransporter 7 n=1 Tax=Leeuwenhoekiella aestuarii TaxID=2249426 RepID=A0A4Q0NSW1_9FLAO|nr:bile acid:sodium symporter [Leeuwenhoekiella aestuarii]RXG13217.1 sodium/bile acid cotransporter 7 [Leeuwenhoekiella aestuarii]RXG15047.1 sodium/bile acid cotransporter 7 [Leeuwenhoekiella aestuarii]
MRIKLDKFVVSIIIIIIVAYFFPQWGLESSPVPLDLIGTLGISLIFFFYGLKLSPQKLKAGLSNYKLHILVQASTFLLFPVLVLLFRPLIQNEEQEIIWLAFFFLAALPSTVSSSVVMVSLAKGNIPAAIFNASISGIIGIAITPLWIGLFVTEIASDFDFSTIYSKLLLQILLPVIVGVLLQKYWGDFIRKHTSKLTLFDKSIILLIIYKSFAESFADNLFTSVSIFDLILLFAGVIGVFVVVFLITGLIAKLLGFNMEDRITAQFCGTKKSLVHGTVFSKILFGNMAGLGLILLPLMLFHASQIMIISAIASRFARKVDVEKANEIAPEA